MKLFLICILGLLTIESFSSNKGDKNLSKALYKEQKAIAINKYAPKMLNKNRKEIKWTKHFNISAKCDTIFMLEAYDLQLESGILISYGTLWNSKGDEFSYERINNEKVIEVRDKECFAKYMKYLINEWDTIQIKKEEKESRVIPCFDIYATRIIFFDNKYSLNCISFSDFVNFKKDLLFE